LFPLNLARWPFQRARLQLAYGIWLRRQRRPADSRLPLRSARATFEVLGAVPWEERARQELRATGETVRRRAPEARDELTPQERQVAEMAAAGLSKPRDRPAAVPLAPLGRVTSVQALPEARRYLTRTARGDLPTRPLAIWLASAQPQDDIGARLCELAATSSGTALA